MADRMTDRIDLRIVIEPYSRVELNDSARVEVEYVTVARLIVPIDQDAERAKRFYAELGDYAERYGFEACYGIYVLCYSSDDFTKKTFAKAVKDLRRWTEVWLQNNDPLKTM